MGLILAKPMCTVLLKDPYVEPRLVCRPNNLQRTPQNISVQLACHNTSHVLTGQSVANECYSEFDSGSGRTNDQCVGHRINEWCTYACRYHVYLFVYLKNEVDAQFSDVLRMRSISQRTFDPFESCRDVVLIVSVHPLTVIEKIIDICHHACSSNVYPEENR